MKLNFKIFYPFVLIYFSVLFSSNTVLQNGCTDQLACNYDENAIEDDGSCQYDDCLGECGGSAILDECGVCNGIGAEDLYECDGSPSVFQHSVSIFQGFYFFQQVTLNGLPLESNDWVAAFKGEICVGARQWDTNSCGAGVCDVPAMGDDGSEWTEGYLVPGDIPNFKIFDASSGTVYDAYPSNNIDSWILNLMSINDLLEVSVELIGCVDELACNYDANATIEGDCIFPDENYNCDGDCISDIDCEGICGGVAVLDDCGVCSGGNTEHIANSDQDCNGDCFGSAFIDGCSDCVGGNTGIEECLEDCNGVSGGDAFWDDCGVCSGGNTGHIENSDMDCAGICFGENNLNFLGECCLDIDKDACGRCFGSSFCNNASSDNFGQCVDGDFNVGELGVSGFDCSGICFGISNYGDDSCLDCAGTPNSDMPAELDDCGICSGGESGHVANSDKDCAGICFGNTLLDECGECGGDGLSCQLGCTDINASNYYCNIYDCENNQLPDGFEEDGSCTYSIQGTIIYYSFNPIKEIPNVSVTIYGQNLNEFNLPENSDSLNTAVTDINGNFIIPDVPSNYDIFYLDYYFEPEESIYTGIQDNDASLLLDVVVGNTTFEYQEYSAIAADVNLNGIVNSWDASLIGRFMNDPNFNMNDSNIRWKFESSMDSTTNIAVDWLENIMIYGIKLGDINGSWD